MRRCYKRILPGGVALALILALTGCGGDSKKGQPKVNDNAPKMQEKTRSGSGGPKKGEPQ